MVRDLPKSINPRSREGRQQSDLRHLRADRTKFHTVDQIAEALEISTRTVRRWIDSGQLVAHRFDRVVRIAESDVQTFLTAHRGAKR
jgi:excisionase family DNA binding protein